MTTSTAPLLSGLPPATGQTVDRALVHRASLSEVFLTDLRHEDDGFLATAQLPRSHAYWGDHMLAPASYDPVLLIEVARQAVMAGSHLFYGAPMDSKFILSQQTLALSWPGRLTIGPEPAVLLLRATVTDRRGREGQSTALDYSLRLYAVPADEDGGSATAEVGSAEVGLCFMTPDSYASLRLRSRQGLAPFSSARIPVAQPAFPAAPDMVGRRLPDNVVLCEPRPDATGTAATLHIAASHPSLFDHPQEHVPGMVLIEGARQLALHTVREQLGLCPGRLRVLGVRAAYRRFGELDAPVSLHTGPPSSAASLVADQLDVTVTAGQNGETIADFTVTLGRVPR